MAILIRKAAWLLRVLAIIFGMAAAGWCADRAASGELLILCYHSIQPNDRPGDPYTLSQQRFVGQLEYLHAHGYHPVSFEEVAAAQAGTQQLPPKAVLLTFDDGYRSYHDFVVPVLDLYGYPSMVALVGSWLESSPPEDLSEPLMNWEQIRRVAAHPKVTVVSHSFDLHKAAACTPQGDTGAVIGVRAYDPRTGLYESVSAYRDKLRSDFERQRYLFIKHLGRAPRAIVWPYGQYNEISMQVAAESGLGLGFALNERNSGVARLSQRLCLNRELVLNEAIDLFIYSLRHLDARQAPMRAAQVDLDLIYAPESAEQTDRNLGRLVERLTALQVNTVFLQAFADPQGDGNIHSVYFHNRVLPVRADIFGHAVHQLRNSGIQVFAWMPALSYVFEDADFNQRFGVREYQNGHTRLSSSWYRRLTPFSPEVARQVGKLFEDLSEGALISGILFQDDAYLSDAEDVHPLALEAFGKHVGQTITPAMLSSDAALARQWMHFKTDALMNYIDILAAAVRIYRPDARFARNLYARMLLEPQAEQWFAQNYDLYLKRYDYVVVMAYPQMENERRPVAWLKQLADAAARPHTKAKTVFKLQAFDWQRKQWLPDRLLLEEMRAVLAAGIHHIAYYPDNLWMGKPDIKTIEREISTRSRPSGE